MMSLAARLSTLLAPRIQPTICQYILHANLLYQWRFAALKPCYLLGDVRARDSRAIFNGIYQMAVRLGPVDVAELTAKETGNISWP